MVLLFFFLTLIVNVSAQTLTPSSTSYCAGGSITFTITGATPSSSYDLYKDGSDVETETADISGTVTFTGNYTAGDFTTDPATNEVDITENPLPTAYNVTGTGTYCSGDEITDVGLDGSDNGVNYQLYLDLSAVGSPVAGNTGNSIDLGNQPTTGTYTVVATDASTGCINNMNGEADITINDLPNAYNVTGGGSDCSGGSGVDVGLDNSDINVNYQLYIDLSAVGSPVAGNTGNSIDFGNQTTTGTYTVVATDASTGCTNNMTGEADITINDLPNAYNVTGGGSYCSGGSGVDVGLDYSDDWVNYQLYNGTNTIGSPIQGTNGILNFGYQTAGGIYTVVAVDGTTGCINNMNGSAGVYEYLAPTTYTVTGGGSYCSGKSGVHVGLDGSDSGVNYQLYNGASYVSSAVGDGNPIDFGNQTTAGTYTVVATGTTLISNIAGCTISMNGSATVVVNPLPTVYDVTGGGSYCSGSLGVDVGLDGSDIGVNYQLFNGINLYHGIQAIGDPVQGTGNALDFGYQTASGAYTVFATNDLTGCTNFMNDSATITVNSLPTAYHVTGGGAYCSGGSGVDVGLDYSDDWVNYQLFNGTNTVGDPVPGTDDVLDFDYQTAGGTYTVVATDGITGCTNNMNGETDITINYGTHNVITETACNSYLWHGTTYTVGGTYSFNYSNGTGCASTDTLHLTINTSTTGDTTATACTSFKWYGMTYNTSSTPTHILTNKKGCDSTVTLNLTINNNTTSSTTHTACNSYLWNSITYTTSGDEIFNKTNSKGCDSTATLHLTINYSTTGDTSATVCNSFGWYGYIYTTSSTPTHILTNKAGCDSTVTLNLTVTVCTGIGETVSTFHVLIYPNPSTNCITIENPQQGEIEILNVQGQVIETFKAINNKTNVNVSAFAAGLYIVEIKTGNGIAIEKFVKE
ncbi:MAG: T9SS type A sorting domain-containing protein [Bacteroidales bacterium]